ncbi:MAG: ABC transporter permease [Gaiellaceae bacterium]|jgi:hypothetical protein
MNKDQMHLLRVEQALGFGSGALFALTLLWTDWVELVFRVDPDRGNGALEWTISLAFLALTIAFGMLARRERARLQQRISPRE